jgi:energy-coupling factor transport system ATP-binding protein
MREPAILFENFGFQYRAQADPTLYEIDLAIYPGEKVLVAGPSGSGKSTLAHCINGLIPFNNPGISTGRCLVNGVPTKDQSVFELSKTIGTVLQDTDGQFVGLTAGEDIAFSLENNMTPQAEMFPLVRAAADLTGIEGFLDSSPFELSGGQKQRVSMAGVLVDKDVRILLFDEPLANLDPATGKQAIDLIDRIKKETNTTVVIIEHRIEDVLYRNVDRIVLMDEGRITYDGPPGDLLRGDLLRKTGIREPLYVTALKYAGIELGPEHHCESIDTLSLSEQDIETVQRWYPEKDPLPAAAGEEELLHAESLSFTYPEGQKPALTDVGFSISKGEITAIVGANGAGKSTLAKLVCGFEKLSEGSIALHGEDISDESIAGRARHIGYVMQNPNQMICKPMIFEEVALALESRGLSEEEIKKRVGEVLTVCGLYPFRSWPINALSYGQKKRVTIASVLVTSPEIIILDEPTAGQDYRHYTDIMDFLLTLNKQGVTILLITHDMHLMLEYAPRTLAFSAGKMLADSPSADLLCDVDLTAAASLKETSLFHLATMCRIEDAPAFVRRFVEAERG